MSVAVAASDPDQKKLLMALRDSIAEAIDEGVPARDLASLSRRLMEIRREIEAMEVEEKEAAENAVSPDEEFDPDEI